MTPYSEFVVATGVFTGRLFEGDRTAMEPAAGCDLVEGDYTNGFYRVVGDAVTDAATEHLDRSPWLKVSLMT